MTSITDMYRMLFGREGTNKGTDIEMSEHGRAGGLSTGQPFKHVAIIGSGSGGSVTHTNTNTGNEELRVYQENYVSTLNTSSTPLGGGETFTGQWEDAANYQEINVSIVADQNSATNGLVFQWSPDGSIIGDTDVFSYYTASGGTNYTPNPAFRYFRIVYTNGSSAQSSFNILTIFRRGVTGGSFHRIDSTLKDDSDGRLVVSVPKLRTAQNTYVSQTATTAGNSKISIEEYNGSVETGGLPTRQAFNTNNIDEATTTLTYIGMESMSGAWYVKKIDTTSGAVFTHATVTNNAGVTTYSSAWNGRAALTYGSFSQAF